jgi:ankyrin repeat protein
MPSSQTAWTSSCSGAHRGKTALHIAAERGNLRIVQLLLEHEVDVDVADASGCTALHYAARGAHAEVVALLLAEGADSEARDGEGRSPLHAAADAECESVIRLLAKDGADLNAAIGCVITGGAATSISVFSGSGEGGEVDDVF